MIILFAGSTPRVRGALAETICDEHERWRHMAIEDLAESVEKGLGKEYDEEHLVAIVCHSANTMQRDGYHMILTLSDARNLLPVIRENIEGDSLSIHLGEPEEELIDLFDHVINTENASIKDIYAFLRPLVTDPPDV